ncbi:MAG: DUF1343 domain-containing protein [Deltaproteobacteria bacterium]|nr:DUF1343 domain-containing protein [Deltaproteobacteria bacterium]MBW1918784.1 DUF1343 domain-containing protein [Deltaproteobacteria bacterium]MBW1934793.1 DUF1343 domain-containing protein [Deltaproteobacteria bacterium]MBW1976554.1 DUF1343 domain-containing protein [Deltaproteobacteria bacterium]MBW2044934.1 DUF1343 domain-containing protein [Deltaproteobacteria bacterium]
MASIKVLTGLEVFKHEYWPKLKGYNLGLLSNQASVDFRLQPAKKVISELLPGHIKALFGPQHGYGVQDQDNMVETQHSFDKELGAPIFSLYSEVRKPTPEMLEPVDILIIDLQDVGTRVYTFASTVLACLKAARQLGKKVIILDRPNPLGGETVEGNLLDPALFSFVGAYRFPMRHALTMGEIALIFNCELDIGADLDIVTMKGWKRSMIWQDTELRWIMPSPNMPIPETAQVYPGQVLWEGTNISEGRGTCRPFEIFGSPFMDTKGILKRLFPEATAGCILQEIMFRPTFNKWEQETCRGFMIHITDQHVYCPYFTSIALLQAVLAIHPEEFSWKPPPYEYEYQKMPIDMILGDSSLRKEIETGTSPFRIREGWVEDLKRFLEWRDSYLLYN